MKLSLGQGQLSCEIKEKRESVSTLKLNLSNILQILGNARFDEGLMQLNACLEVPPFISLTIMQCVES